MDITKEYKTLNTIHGLNITKHFIERYYERFNDYGTLLNVMKYLNKNLCVLIYETILNGGSFDLHIDDIVVPLVYSDLNKTPTLLCKTIYRKGKHG